MTVKGSHDARGTKRSYVRLRPTAAVEIAGPREHAVVEAVKEGIEKSLPEINYQVTSFQSIDQYMDERNN